MFGEMEKMGYLKGEKNNQFDKCIELTHEVENILSGEEVLDDGLGSKWRIWKRRRYLVITLTFIGQIIRDVLRTNLSVAILSMTENITTTTENGTVVYVQEFEWDVKTCGLLLSMFFYGYITTILAGGILAVKFGGTKLYGLGIGITSFTTILTPAVAYLNLYLLMALRIFEGICEGILLPSVEYVYASWIPLEERSTLVGFSSSGGHWGAFIGTAVSGVIAHHWGWPAIFYTTGAVGLLWFLVWVLNVKEYPRLDKKISPSEKSYIENTIKKRLILYRTINSVPLFKILTSIPLWALIIGHIPLICGSVLFTTLLPSYMKDVQKQDTQNSGFLASLPFLASLLSVYFFSPLADIMVNRKILVNITVRKIFICGSLITMAIFCFIVQQVTSTPAVVACFVGMMFSVGAAYAQTVVNLLDLAPSYSSVMCGLFITVNMLCAMQTPTIAAYITPNKTAEEWSTVFSILGGMSLVSAAIYCAFGSGQLQPWAAEREGENSNPNVAQE